MVISRISFLLHSKTKLNSAPSYKKHSQQTTVFQQGRAGSQMHLPINIQHANERMLLDSRMESLIDMVYNPVKEFGIDVLC